MYYIATFPAQNVQNMYIRAELGVEPLCSMLPYPGTIFYNFDMILESTPMVRFIQWQAENWVKLTKTQIQSTM